MSTSLSLTRPLSKQESFTCGGLAACIAVTISNPADVAKTRLQLQGQLMKHGSNKIYNNVGEALSKTWRMEGVRGLQRGLSPAYGYQILVNGCRLGFYESFRENLNKFIGQSREKQIPVTSVIAGASSGAIGAALGNPLFLIKSRMQAYSPALAIGTQRIYKNSLQALSSILRTEGLRGLVRGADAAVIRTSLGSSIQLPSYNFTKNQLAKHNLLSVNSTWNFLISSFVSSACILLVMQPADTALTRMYNQPTVVRPDGKTRGTLYKNMADCIWKSLLSEGLRGCYKGTTAHFLRLAPHTIIVLTANDIIVGMYKKATARDP